MKIFRHWRIWMYILGFGLGIFLILIGVGVIGDSVMPDIAVMQFEGAGL